MADGGFGFRLKRALFVQPLGMTLSVLRGKLRARRAADHQPALRPPIDIQYDIDTAGVIPASALRTGSRSDLYNFAYAGSQPSIIRQVLVKIPDLDQANFIDIGCGKGRALVVATEYPFRKIVGVELSPELVETAKMNAMGLHDQFPERTFIDLHCEDALNFDLPEGYNVIYFYNPAYEGLLRELAVKIAVHAASPGNKTVVVYYNPAFGRVFEEHPAFDRYYARRHRMDDDEAAASEFGNIEESVIMWQAGEPRLSPHPGADARLRIVAGGAAAVVG